MTTLQASSSIHGFLSRLQPVCALSELRRNELADQCAIEWTPRGENPFSQHGMSGESVWLIDGEIKLDLADGSTRVLVGNTGETQWPLGKNLPAVRGAKAITDVGIVRINDETLDIMMTWDQLSEATTEAATLPEKPDWRLMSGAFHLQSLTVGALSHLPPANIDALLRRFERVRHKAGDFILRQGDEGDYYYLIESGHCTVTRQVGGVELTLAELKPGDAFGEEALVAESRRNATVTMKRDGVLLRLGKRDFVELLREPLLHRLSRAAAETRVAAGATWIDVRYSSEYQNERLPGALNVPLAEIRNAIGVLDRQHEYVVYCQSGRRSSAAAFLLSQHGYAAAWLEGGLQHGGNGVLKGPAS